MDNGPSRVSENELGRRLKALVKRGALAIKVTGKAGRVLSKRVLGTDGLKSSFGWTVNGGRPPRRD